MLGSYARNITAHHVVLFPYLVFVLPWSRIFRRKKVATDLLSYASVVVVEMYPQLLLVID